MPIGETLLKPQNEASFLQLNDISKTYRSRDGVEVLAVESFSANIEAGQFVSLVGPSGCGKSTLLSILAGLVPPSRGECFIGGKRVDGPHTELGFMFQTDLLMDWRTVLGNVLVQIEVRGLNVQEYQKRALELLEAVGLRGFEHKHPFELSGGMRQRVALCRTLIHDPPLLLMDEPFGAVDNLTRDQLQLDLQKLWAETGKTVILVTHSISEAVFLSDRIIVMSPRPGRIQADLHIDLPRPRKRAIRQTEPFIRYVQQISDLFAQMGVINE